MHTEFVDLDENELKTVAKAGFHWDCSACDFDKAPYSITFQKSEQRIEETVAKVVSSLDSLNSHRTPGFPNKRNL